MTMLFCIAESEIKVIHTYIHTYIHRVDRGWLSHGLVVTLPISYSLDGGTLWGFTRDMRIAD